MLRLMDIVITDSKTTDQGGLLIRNESPLSGTTARAVPPSLFLWNAQVVPFTNSITLGN
jgi:hypothetical protein